MKDEELTPWFPADVPPVHKGVYELPSGLYRAFAYWNGERFGYRCWTQVHGDDEDVPEAVAAAFYMANTETCLSPLSRWRGLSKKSGA